MDVLGAISGEPVFITPTNDGRFFFGAKQEEFASNKVLYVSDGTQSGTIQLTTNTFLNDRDLTRFDIGYAGGLLYFTGQDQASGTYYPWVSDGTIDGTNLLMEIGDGFSNTARNYTEINGNVVFGADQQLWVTDGTEAGTSKLRDLEPNSFFEFDGKLLFDGNDNRINSGTGAELYETDGTAAGTKLVRDIDPGSFWSSPIDMVLYRDEVYFSADTYDFGREIWKTDGTREGTLMVTDVNPSDRSNTGADFLTVVEDKLFFATDDGIHGKELWLFGELPAFSGQIEETKPISCWRDTDGSLTMRVSNGCLLYTSPSPRDRTRSRMPSSA